MEIQCEENNREAGAKSNHVYAAFVCYPPAWLHKGLVGSQERAPAVLMTPWLAHCAMKTKGWQSSGLPAARAPSGTAGPKQGRGSCRNNS